jgi:hypothetical protein
MARRIGGAGGGSDPGKGNGAKTLVAAAAFTLVVVGGTTGAISLGGTSGSGGTTNSASPDLNTRTNEGKKSAKNGKADEAWSRMGLRTLKRAIKRDIKCVAASTDRVREFFLRTPCTSLDRILFAVGDGRGNSAVISIAWVGFRNRGDGDAFERVEKVQGSGDISPLGGALIDLAHIRFTGRHFQSRRDGNTIVIAETESAAGRVNDDVLDALADVAAWLPRP